MKYSRRNWKPASKMMMYCSCVIVFKRDILLLYFYFIFRSRNCNQNVMHKDSVRVVASVAMNGAVSTL